MKKIITLMLAVFFIGSVSLNAQSYLNSNDETSPNQTFQKQTTSSKGAKGWTVQFAHPITNSASAGCETDGTHFYVTEWNGTTIWKFDMTGTQIASFSIPGVSGLRDLAYDGTYFYGGANANVIYKMDLSATTPSLVSTINISPGGKTVRNICYQADSNAFWVGGWATDLSLVNMSGNVIRTIPAGTHGLASTYGTAYDDVSPGGPFIWAIDAGTSGIPATITQINATTGAQTGTTHITDDIASTIGGGLWIHPNIVPGTTTLGGLIQGTAIFGYDLASTIPLNLDLAMNKIHTPIPFVQVNDVVTVTGEVTNFGLTAITSFDINYSIDGGSPFTHNITGVNIAQNGTYNFTHPTTWTPTVVAGYDVAVWASNVNGGGADDDPSNDTITLFVSVVDNFVEKKLLHEVFTSSTCGPCVGGNQNITTVLDANPGKWTCVKYQMSWPQPGDPYYTAEGGVRKTYYGVSGVPNMELNGGWNSNPNSYDQSLFDAFYNEPAFMEISAVHEITGQNIEVQVDITPHADFPAGLKLHIAVVENMTTGNVGNNGETEFHYVMMKMVPDASGTDVGPYVIGTPVSYLETASLAGTFIEEWDDLSVVVFVQEDASWEVYQSAWSVEGTVGIEDIDESSITSIYPNPANSTAFVNYNLTQSSNVNISIHNMLGEEVYSTSPVMQSSGDYKTQLDLNGLSDGVYFLKLQTDNETFTQKLVIN
ncbi:MAG: T9SS type A sorting domain-containing protein [Bacteroidales bacterium]|nr:T9SS type A sorting domain-containing protein [Bacteroidales bacterium]